MSHGVWRAGKKVPRTLENLEAGLHFARSYASYRLLKAPKPLSAVFVVTNRCNLTCKYCNSPFMTDRELSLAEIEKLFDNLRATGIFRLGLTGGEPLLREDIGEIVELAKQRKFFLSMNSNLLLYHEKHHIFNDVDFVFTSLDGPAEAHEKNRGRGSFEGVLNGIADLRQRGKGVIAIAVVGDQDQDIPRLIDYAEKFDFKLHFQVRGTSTLTKTTDIIRGDFSSGFSGAAYREIWRGILAAKKKTRVIASSRRYLESVIEWQDYQELRALKPKGKCAAGFGYIFVDASGTGYPCCLVKKSVAGVNMLKDRWTEVYKGEKPCNNCICGPYLQLNLLYTEPLASFADIYAGYGSFD